jgi:hypothetical protein
MTSATPEMIALIEGEHIVERGSTETIWFVRSLERWVAAAELSGARVIRLEARPGTVWERRVELELPRGATLMRVDSSPYVRKASPLQYLSRTPGTSRRVRRAIFRVEAGGNLSKVSDAPTSK